MDMDESQLAEMEAHAVSMAREAGLILDRYFGTPMDIDYKDKKKRDPVTAADMECHKFLTEAISGQYPHHGIVSEEDVEEEEDKVAPDFVWVVDPLDGTKNFLSGLPVFACSIGVLYKGAPIAGAIYIPWPGESQGLVMHARTGGGAFADEKPIRAYRGVQPEGNRLNAIPGSFDRGFRFDKSMNDRVGEVRVTGSIAYELAMSANGVLQYSIATRPHLWDVVGGAVLASEAGGLVMIGRRQGARLPLAGPRFRWESLDSFTPTWQSGTTTLRELRQWSAPLITGGPDVARFVAGSLKSRSALRRRVARRIRR